MTTMMENQILMVSSSEPHSITDGPNQGRNICPGPPLLRVSLDNPAPIPIKSPGLGGPRTIELHREETG